MAKRRRTPARRSDIGDDRLVPIGNELLAVVSAAQEDDTDEAHLTTVGFALHMKRWANALQLTDRPATDAGPTSIMLDNADLLGYQHFAAVVVGLTPDEERKMVLAGEPDAEPGWEECTRWASRLEMSTTTPSGAIVLTNEINDLPHAVLDRAEQIAQRLRPDP